MKDDEQSMCNHADRERLKILVFGMHEKTHFLHLVESVQIWKKREDKKSWVLA